MAATFDQIETALLAPFVSVANGGTGQWTATPDGTVGYENCGFDPTTAGLSEWMEVTVDSGHQRALTNDDAFVGTPVVMIAAHTALGIGKQAARQLLDAAVAMYRGAQLTAGASSLRLYSVSRVVELPKEGWFKLAVQLSFRLV